MDPTGLTHPKIESEEVAFKEGEVRGSLMTCPIFLFLGPNDKMLQSENLISLTQTVSIQSQWGKQKALLSEKSVPC